MSISGEVAWLKQSISVSGGPEAAFPGFRTRFRLEDCGKGLARDTEGVFFQQVWGLWYRGSSTVGDHYCHSSTSEGMYLLFAQQNSSTEEPHLNWGFARLVGSVSQEINFIKTIAAGINFLAIADSWTSFWISDLNIRSWFFPIFDVRFWIFSDFGF